MVMVIIPPRGCLTEFEVELAALNAVALVLYMLLLVTNVRR